MKTEEELQVRRTILIGSFSWSIGGQTHRSRHHQQDFPSLIYNNWSNHILTSFVIYYCEDAQQHGIYLLISSSCEEAERLSWIWPFCSVSGMIWMHSYIISMVCCSFFETIKGVIFHLICLIDRKTFVLVSWLRLQCERSFAHDYQPQ